MSPARVANGTPFATGIPELNPDDRMALTIGFIKPGAYGAAAAKGRASKPPIGAVMTASAPSSPVPVDIGYCCLNGATRDCVSAWRRWASAIKA